MYYVPGHQDPTLEQIREWGLGYAFEQSPECRLVSRGPLGSDLGAGCIFHDPKRNVGVQFRLNEEEQHWRRIETRQGKEPEIWLGWNKEAPPKPSDLERESMLPGFTVKLADGNDWTLPVVCRFDWETNDRLSVLPSYFDIDSRGRLVMGEIQERHRWLWELTQPAWDAMLTEADFDDQAALAIVGGLYSANYVVNAMEMLALRCFGPMRHSPAGLVALAIDYLTWKKWHDAQKKTSPSHSTTAGSSTSPGETADFQGSLPRELIS